MKISAKVAALTAASVLSIIPTTATPAEAGAGCVRTSRDVLVIGDSMTVGATPLINRVKPDWRIDAKWGRGVTQLPVQIQRWKDTHRLAPKVLVIALGTNEQIGWDRGDYVQAIRMFPVSTRIVMVNTYRPAAGRAGLSDGLVYSQWMNQIAQTFNASNRQTHHRVAVANWRKPAMADPTLIRDGLHQSEKGLVVWVKAVRDAVIRVTGLRGCN